MWLLLTGNRASEGNVDADTPQERIFEKVFDGDPLRALEILGDEARRHALTMACISDAEGFTLYLWTRENGIVINTLV